MNWGSVILGSDGQARIDSKRSSSGAISVEFRLNCGNLV
jgi:hypothetical protein